MEPRVHLITLGVSDLKKATEFYVNVLGWSIADQTPTITFFDIGGAMLSLYPHEEMVKEWDETLTEVPSYRGFALAHNLNSEAEVDELFARLREKGATIVKEPKKVFWGGYSGYFADPDGNKWEVAHNPFWIVREDGRIEKRAE